MYQKMRTDKPTVIADTLQPNANKQAISYLFVSSHGNVERISNLQLHFIQ